MVLRAYKYRLYPTKEQEQFLLQNFGAVRFVWNQLVANFNSWSKDKPVQTVTEKTLKDDPRYPWLNEAISYALQQKRMDFDETKKQFFNKKRAIKLGRMKFKCKGRSRDSFRIPGSVLPKANLEMCETGQIVIPKMTPMKMVVDRKFHGIIKNITVSRNKANQYFVSVLVEEAKPEPLPNTYRAVGIDLGLKDLAVLSDGHRLTNPRWFRESQSKLKRAQQHLSRKQKGSNRRKRQQLKVNRIYLKIINQRNHLHHEFSKWLVENYDYIYLEDLAVQEMMQSKSKTRNKNIADASWSSLVSKIEYKANWYGKEFAKVDRYFASSQVCSTCGHHDGKKSLDVRQWTCSSCGSVHDRDLNAAKNIEQEASRDLVNWIKRGNRELSNSAESVENRHREVLRPVVGTTLAASLKCPAIL
jgi:putative transposase